MTYYCQRYIKYFSPPPQKSLILKSPSCVESYHQEDVQLLVGEAAGIEPLFFASYELTLDFDPFKMQLKLPKI